jgi:hypothetical protein
MIYNYNFSNYITRREEQFQERGLAASPRAVNILLV